MKLFGFASLLLLTGLPLAADPISYVMISSSTTGALIRASGDFHSLTTIAPISNGTGVGKDLNGDYLVTTSKSLLRVTPTGTVTAIANAPTIPPTGWVGVVTDAQGNYIVVDNVQHAVWRISPNGAAVLKVANYTVMNSPEQEDANILLDPNGNYLVLEDNGSVAQMFSITPAGGVTQITLSGAAATATDGFTADGAGNYLFSSFRDDSVFSVTPGGIVSVFAHMGTQICCNLAGIARNPDNGELSVPTFGGSVLRINPNGNFVSTVAPSGATLNHLQGIIVETYGALPHLTVGNVWTTGFFVVNTGNQPALFSISFFDDSGNPLAIPFGAPIGTVSTYQGTVPAAGMTYVEASDPSASTPVSVWGLISSDPTVTVQALFRRQTAGTYYEAAVGATAGSFGFTLPFDASTFVPTGDALYTGFAIANLDALNAAAVSCVAADQNGVVIPNGVPLPNISPLGHYANYLFSALAGIRGTLSCTSSAKVAAIAIRAIGTNAISTLPVIGQ
jgi:hypothetical protein